MMDPLLMCVLVCPLWHGVCASSSGVLSVCCSRQCSGLKGKSHGPPGNAVPLGDLTPVFVGLLTLGMVAHPLLCCLPRAQVLPVWSSWAALTLLQFSRSPGSLYSTWFSSLSLLSSAWVIPPFSYFGPLPVFWRQPDVPFPTKPSFPRPQTCCW